MTEFISKVYDRGKVIHETQESDGNSSFEQYTHCNFYLNGDCLDVTLGKVEYNASDNVFLFNWYVINN